MSEPSTLFLDDVPSGAWAAFQRGDVPAELDASRSHVQCWQRARELGARASGLPPDDGLLRGSALRERTEHLELLQSLGTSALSRAARRLSERNFLLLCADPDGVVVDTRGGGEFGDEARKLRLISGAHWSESARGTNAIGTALAERRPTVVLGRGHYGEPYHDLACYAAPVIGAHGEVVAVLDATSRVQHAEPEVGHIVSATAQVLSELLRLEAYARAGRSVLRMLESTLEHAADATVVIEPPGRVARLNEKARALLGISAGEGIEAAFGLGWTQLITGRAHALQTPNADLELTTEPVPGADGRPLAVLVRLARKTAASLSRPLARGGRVAPRSEAFATIFAEDPAMVRAIETAAVLAESELPLMILAETGAGKELFAQAIHAHGPRRDQPFMAVNCGAIAPSLLESELFGYAPGAFTGADRRGREGFFHEADGGTLFLDEVAEMPLAMQAALLRVLDSGAYQRVGESRARTCRVRIVCATCRDLPGAVAEGRFRADLYYRLKGARVRLPALRERSDALVLTEHLVRARASRAGYREPPALAADFRERVQQHAWPGNVRELISAVDLALVLARSAGSDRLLAEHLPDDVGAAAAPASGTTSPAKGALREAEAETVRRVLARFSGNVSAAARELGVARSTLYRLVRKLGLQGALQRQR